MGRDDGPDNEQPRHRVRLGAFRIMRAPVSRALYQRFLDATGHPAPPFWSAPHLSHPDQPACGPSWHDACAFAAWLDGGLRLPTEAEREWASRGGSLETRFPWGDAPLHPPAGPCGGPGLIGGTDPNGFGLLNMADGVHEWCSDWYGADYYTVAPVDNPAGPTEGSRRVARGGSWRHQIRVTACTARSSLPPDHRYEDFGFRLVQN